MTLRRKLHETSKADSPHLTSELGTAGEHGTGIGLPLCLELVKLNKGQLTIESESGKGTIVTVTLPKAE